jgi:hypothetical protein
MKLSDALLNGRVHFAIQRNEDGVPVRYKDFQGAVQDSIPDANAQTFPLAFAFPMFGIEMESEVYRGVIEALPEIGRPPASVKIWFLSSSIDCLSIGHLWTEQQVGEVIRRIEDHLATFGMTEENGYCNPDAIPSKPETAESASVKRAILEALDDMGGEASFTQLMDELRNRGVVGDSEPAPAPKKN